jgi:hypothetical protein
MKLNLKSVRKMCIIGVAASAMQFVAMNSAFANEQDKEETQEAPVTPLDPAENSQESVSAETVSATPAEWVIHMHGVLGSAQTSSVTNFKSDRLGAAVFAGTILTDFELPMLLADAKDFSLGLSYQTFTGVSASQNQAVSLQSLGAQARFVLAPSFLSGADLSVHGGVALQRLVAENQTDGLEKTQLGGALTAGAYVRWLVLGPLAVLTGADLVAGSASWGGVSAGVEASF